MADDADMAADLAERERSASVSRAVAVATRAGRSDCADCGQPIAAARRAAAPGSIRCADCQAEQERTRT